MTRVKIEPLTLPMYYRFYTDNPNGTVQGWLIRYDGLPAACAGIQVRFGRATFFCDVPNIEQYPKMAIWRAAKDVVKRVKKLGYVVYAEANPELPNSTGFLERLGFRLISVDRVNYSLIYRLDK